MYNLSGRISRSWIIRYTISRFIYFDNGATTQKPRPVVEKIESGYYNVNANIHRGVHFLSQAATEAHEDARKTVQQFLNARSANEIVFTRGTTEAINLIASSFTDGCMSAGDEVIVSVMEHHSQYRSLADTGCP
mgnify:CR=1 FL=1